MQLTLLRCCEISKCKIPFTPSTGIKRTNWLSRFIPLSRSIHWALFDIVEKQEFELI